MGFHLKYHILPDLLQIQELVDKQLSVEEAIYVGMNTYNGNSSLTYYVQSEISEISS